MSTLFQNWKTTSAGVTAIAGSVIHLVFELRSGHADENAWSIAVAGILLGIGLMLAGDASQSQPKQPTAPPNPPPQNPT
jgi:hypothetical protein